MIYFICFVISAGFAHLANKCRKRDQVIFFSVLSILVTVTLAGLRDYSIGIDTDNYLSINRYWVSASTANSLAAHMDTFMQAGYNEPLFGLLIGVVGQWFGEYRVFLFVVHGIIITCVYIGAYRHRRYVNPALILFLFYLYFYSHSLNISRQYIAMALLFAVVADLYQGKWKRYLIINIVAIMFHTSAIMGIGPLIIYTLLYKNKRLYTTTQLRKLIIISACLFLLVAATSLLDFLMSVGVLADKYVFYLENETTSTLLISLFLLVELLFIALYHKQINSEIPMAEYFIICSVVYFILQQLSNSLAYGKRIAQYFSCINIITIALLTKAPKLKVNRQLVFAGVVLLSVFYWWYAYILRNASETHPYILGV